MQSDWDLNIKEVFKFRQALEKMGWGEILHIHNRDVHEFLHASLGPNSHSQWFYILAWQLIKYFCKAVKKYICNASYDLFTYTDGIGCKYVKRKCP